MLAIAAALPIVVAMALFLARAKAVNMALWSLATGLAVALVFFPAGPGKWLDAGVLFGPTIIEVLLILFGGVLLSRITTETGAMASISGWLGRSASHPQAGTVLVVFGLVPFAESVTGFGIGVTVGVPLLLRLGHDVRRAAVLSLLGLVAVPWGALGPGTLVAADLAGLSLQDMGVRSALLSPPVMLGSALTCWLVLRRGAERPGRLLAHLVAAALLLNCGILAANLLMGTPPAGIVGSLVVILVHLAAFKIAGSLVPAGPQVLRSLLPYGVLTAGLLLARLATMGMDASLSKRALASGGVWLLIACLVAHHLAPERGTNARPLGSRMHAAYRSWIPVGVTTGAFTVLGAILALSGMGQELGSTLAAMGPAYLVLGPIAGGFAGFISGSNTGANSMLAATQAQAALAMGSSVLQLVAASNVAASMATMLAPSRILLAYEMAALDPGRDSDPDAEHPGEQEVTAWVAPKIAALLACVCTLLGVVTWVIH
ncbi:L-lactate permease [Paeniglutamicibacter kerguelensis]|uniref:L-lactate permease n=1 Tax=Paeniglutamicibacter kerguelensis TaxID=254788 RepID=A0ABS4XHD7_9MICC|nr:L-lactate permease [Paeniglutamicibacter kerguelensis]MBP2387668.1 lactate permease [Paeniglutamicibacter kerguelensis]